MSTSEPVARTTETHKYTPSPGPWSCFFKHKYNEWHVGVPLSSGTMKLALFPDGCPTDNPEADCHLIAAAPDLLALAKKLAGECAECGGVGYQLVDTGMPVDSQIDCPDCYDIRTVISKAEGRP